MENQLLNMKTHEKINFDNYEVLRVQNGWIYTYFSINPFYDSYQIGREIITSSSVFVPDNKIKTNINIDKKSDFI